MNRTNPIVAFDEIHKYSKRKQFLRGDNLYGKRTKIIVTGSIRMDIYKKGMKAWWGGIQDEGKRAETFVACHLLKAVEGWSDLGYGDFSIHYLRDKAKREVDFVVTRDNAPGF